MKVNLPVTQIERDYPDDERLISETDLKGFITSANASFCAVSGYSHAELVGQRHNIVRHPDVLPAVFADMWRTLKAGERWVGVVKNRCKNGDHYWVKAFVGPIVRGGKMVGYRSVRVKPTRAEIEKAVQLYRRLWAGEKGLLDTLGALQRSQGWAGPGITAGSQRDRWRGAAAAVRPSSHRQAFSNWSTARIAATPYAAAGPPPMAMATPTASALSWRVARTPSATET